MKHKDVLFPGLFVVLLALFSYFLLGKIGPIVIGGAGAGGFMLYLKTSYKTHFDTSKVIIYYLLAVIFFIVHVYEEYIFGFEQVASQLGGSSVSQRDFLTFAAFFGPIMWIAGAILILKKWPLGYYFLSFFYFAMTVAELTHFVFPFILYGKWQYTAGVVTAALPLIPAWMGLRITLLETRRIKAERQQQ